MRPGLFFAKFLRHCLGFSPKLPCCRSKTWEGGEFRVNIDSTLVQDDHTVFTEANIQIVQMSQPDDAGPSFTQQKIPIDTSDFSTSNQNIIEKLNIDLDNIKETFCCAITFQIMDDPVNIGNPKILGNDIWCEKIIIEQWVTEHGTCPFTMRELELNSLKIDEKHKNKIEEYIQPLKKLYNNGCILPNLFFPRSPLPNFFFLSPQTRLFKNLNNNGSVLPGLFYQRLPYLLFKNPDLLLKMRQNAIKSKVKKTGPQKDDQIGLSKGIVAQLKIS